MEMTEMTPEVRKPKATPAKDFAQRMQLACDGNLDVPPPNYGRLGWFQRQFEDRGITISPETVRRWFAGEARPRHKMIHTLAQVLQVDEAWLAVGTSPELSNKEQRVRNAAAGGAINMVAGMIEMCGGRAAFPKEGDARAESAKIDITAIIKGAQYSIHVATADVIEGGWRFALPAGTTALVIGVIRTGDLSVDLIELDSDGLEAHGRRRGGSVEVILNEQRATEGHVWRPIETFATRL